MNVQQAAKESLIAAISSPGGHKMCYDQEDHEIFVRSPAGLGWRHAFWLQSAIVTGKHSFL